MKRTPLKRGASQLKRTPLKRASKKTAKALIVYRKLKAEFYAKPDNQRCHICPILWNANVVITCSGVENMPHHVKRRGPYLNDTSTWLATCRNAHNYVETHASLARELGLIQT